MYVPADQPSKLDKARTSGADAIIADLEDAVAADAKAAARTSVANWLERLASVSPEADVEARPRIWLRVNANTVEADLQAALHPLIDGVCLPKVESADAIREIDMLLGRLEAGSSPRPLMLMVETALGVLRCASFPSASERVALFQLGEQDLRANLGLPPDLSKGADPLPGPMQAARDAVVLGSAAGGLIGPIGPVSVNIHDADLLETETSRLRHAGFSGRALIHPAQIKPVARGFAPSAAERDWAQRVVDAAESARAAGSGVTVVDGGMVDAPVVATARRMLSS
jgi:citrate lyase subunit beta/citryl-CoA lyase